MTSTGGLHRAGIAIVALNFLFNVVHSAAHSVLQIFLPQFWQNAYILLVIVVLPLVSGVLLWRRVRGGFLLLLLSMLGSLLFGAYYHFIVPGPDNVASVGHHSWGFLFQLSAALLAVTEVAGAVIGLIGLIKSLRRPGAH